MSNDLDDPVSDVRAETAIYKFLAVGGLGFLVMLLVMIIASGTDWSTAALVLNAIITVSAFLFIVVLSLPMFQNFMQGVRKH